LPIRRKGEVSRWDLSASKEASEGFASRLRARLCDPVNLSVPPVIAAFCLIRSWGLIASIPYWAIAALVLTALAVNSVNAALLEDATGGWRLQVRVAVAMVVIAAVIYGIGWGPILAIGFIFGGVDAMRSAGSAAAKPAIVWTLVCIALGQAAIAIGAAPTLIHQPLVDSLAGLDALGAVVTIKVLEWFAVAREASEGRFEALVHGASDIIVVADPTGHLSYVSPAFSRLLGISADRLAAGSAAEMMHPDDLASLRSRAGEIGGTAGQGLRTEMRLKHADGSWHWFEATVTNHLSNPKVRGIVGNLHDITDRKHTEESLREAHERFHSAFENAPIGMALTDLAGVFMRTNRAFGEIVGIDQHHLEGMSIRDVVHPDFLDTLDAELQAMASGEVGSVSTEKRYIHSDGHVVWVSVSVSCVKDTSGAPHYLIRQVEDITERHQMQEEISHAAMHDLLTGLPNRLLFMDRLELSLRRAEREGHQVALMFLDLDRFKLVNDSLGHDAGDRLLCLASQQLRSALRDSDTLARFGGDEFTALCEVRDRSEALEIAGRLVGVMRRPMRVSGSEHYVSVSVGLALSEDGCASGAALLRNADVAMFQAKEAGPAHVAVYQPASEVNNLHRLRTSNELHRALERSEMELHYQPVVDLHDDSMVGLEALVRWRHPTRGLLLPGEFISLAEDSGLIVPLGKWVLEEACRQVTEWHAARSKAGAEGARLKIAVNVSARQMADDSFPSTVAGVLDKTGLDPDKLWLEITESTLMSFGESTVALLRSLRSLGVHLEIDDFGTGYSSLSYLKQFPVETLKIDRSFVDEIDHNSGDMAIVRAIIGLGDSLGLSVVAEGVERPTQADELRALGCFMAQGFLFGHPEPARVLDPFPTDDLSVWQLQAQDTA